MKMLYLYRGWNSGTNQAVLDAWRIGSPNVDIKAFDLDTVILSNFRNKFLALPIAYRRGGIKALFPKGGRFIDAVKRSEWYMKAIAKKVDKLQNAEDYDFSLAIGTVIPNMNPCQPHFIYTDLTMRANEYYPDGEKRLDLWKECIPYEEESLRKATLVFTMSDHITRSLVEQYNIQPEKIIRVNAGINSPAPVQMDSSRYSRKNLLFVGVDWERKGGPQLVDAFRRAKIRYPQATLTIVGCSPEIKGPGIEVIGRVPQQQVSQYLARASCFCMVSRREPFGIAYIEAMHAGLPVIASNLGAAPDFVINGQTGFLVDIDDIDEFAGRIEELIGNPDKCLQMGQQARKCAMSEYTWEKTQQKMYQAICSMI
ncbi:MAG: glycosyltransferase family 4 protein [Sedimentisphaerales bacterium]|nr:glycosyltransferase family 4 protein [Sedimentisphaerales bacterium]